MVFMRINPFLAGLIVNFLCLGLFLSPLTKILEMPREQFFDALTQLVAAPKSDKILVVDMDGGDAAGRLRRPWDRSDVAKIITNLAQNGPIAIATDIVFSGNCSTDLSGNIALKQALTLVPVVLGFLIADGSAPAPKPVPPVALKLPLTFPKAWLINGAETACADFEARAKSAAAGFLIGDVDAHVRRVQAYVVIDKNVYPSLGLEAARLALGAKTPILGGNPLALRLQGLFIALEGSGSVRFAASSAGDMENRTIPADDILANKFDGQRVFGKLVFMGSSLPQRGGLRPTASMPLQPSVQIHADVAKALLTNFIPHRPLFMSPIEAAISATLGLLIALATSRVKPLGIVLFASLITIFTFASVVIIYKFFGILFDFIGVGLSSFCVLLMTGLFQFAQVRRAEARARRKFAQYLPKSVVERYIDHPEQGELKGEERQITALFTDIENFTGLAHRLSPQELVDLLNIYFSEINGVIAAYGGMVDKIVGDGVHAFFNAPEDLDDHVNQALDCALAIQTITEDLRHRPSFAHCDFGRTRIGIETGTAVLSEVGTIGRLDYTAHGDAINLAARLQEANKHLGTAICVGPVAASQSGRNLRMVGTQMIRGFGKMQLFTLESIQRL